MNNTVCPHCKGEKIVNGDRTSTMLSDRCFLCSGFGLVDEIIANRYEVAKELRARKEKGILDFTPRVRYNIDL